MAASSYNDIVQKSYIAFYGRPADPNGLTYWTNKIDAAGGNYASIIQAFGTSAEATSLFGGLSNAQAVNTLYNQIFGRDADTTGLNYYVQKLLNGTSTLVTIAYDIIGGAQNADATIVANKLTAAAAWTTAINTADEIVGYAGDAAAAVARAYLATVDATTASVTAAQASVDASLANAVAVGGAAGQTYALTTDVDTIEGSAGNDTIRAVETSSTSTSTFNTGDYIDGKGGNDTLSLTITGSAASLVETVNVETIQVRNLEHVGGALDATNFDGVQTIKLVSPSAGVGISFDNVDTSTTVDLTGYGSTDIDYKSTQLATSADAVTVVLGTVGQSAASTMHLVVSSGIETLNLSASGANYVNLDAGATLKTLDLSGAGSATVTVSSTSTVGVVDARDITGGASVTLNGISASATLYGGAGNDTFDVSGATAGVVAITGGAGNDKVYLGATLGSTDSVDGGAGDDTIYVKQGSLTLNLNNVTNVEAADLQFTATTGTYNASGATVNSYTLSASGNAVALTINNLDAGKTLSFNDDDFEDVTIDTTGGALNLVVGNASAAIDIGALTVTDATSLTLNSVGGATAGAATISGITASKATDLTIGASGQNGFVVDGNVAATNLSTLSITTAGSAGVVSSGSGVQWLSNASALTSLTLSANGSNAADIDLGTAALAITGGKAVSVNLTANDGADIYFQGITGATGNTLTVDLTTGASGSVIDNSGSGTLTITGASGSTLAFSAGLAVDSTITIDQLGLFNGASAAASAQTTISSFVVTNGASANFTLSAASAQTWGDVSITNAGELSVAGTATSTMGNVTINNSGSASVTLGADTIGNVVVTNTGLAGTFTVAGEDVGTVAATFGSAAATLNIGASVSAGQVVGAIDLSGGTDNNTTNVNAGTVGAITTSGASATFTTNVSGITVGAITLGGDLNVLTVNGSSVSTITAVGSATITVSAGSLAALDLRGAVAATANLAGVSAKTYVYTGSGTSVITSGLGDDEIYLTAGTGADTIKFTNTSAGTDIVTGFQAATADDIISISKGGVALVGWDGSAGTVSTGSASVLVVSGATALSSTNNAIVLRGTAFASTSAMLTAIGTGNLAITAGTAIASAGNVIVAWEDTAGDTHVSLVLTSASVAAGRSLFGSGLEVADVTDLVVLTGVDSDNIDGGNLNIIS